MRTATGAAIALTLALAAGALGASPATADPGAPRALASYPSAPHTLAAKPGAVAGRLPADRGKWGKRFPATVLALHLVPAGAQSAALPGKNRRFRLSLPPGVYGVVTTHWQGKRAVPQAHLVRVKTRRASRLTAGASGPIVSVGKVSGPGGTDLSSVLLAGMIDQADASSCGFSMGLDRTDPAYQEVLKELKLNTTKYFSDKVRAEARQALKDQAAYTPQYRVDGTVTQASGEYSGRASGTFRLVQAATGAVLMEKQISFSDSGTTELFKAAAQNLGKAICGIPTAFTGTVQADIVADLTGQRWQWNGTVGFVLKDGGVQPDGSFQISYELQEGNIDSAKYTVPPTDSCSETVAQFSGPPVTRGGSLTLTVHADDSRTYQLALGMLTPPTNATATCGKQTVTVPVPLGLGVQSDPSEAWLGPTLAETYSGPWSPAQMPVSNPFRMNASWVLQPVGLE